MFSTICEPSNANKRVELTSGPAGAGPSAAHAQRYAELEDL